MSQQENWNSTFEKIICHHEKRSNEGPWSVKQVHFEPTVKCNFLSNFSFLLNVSMWQQTHTPCVFHTTSKNTRGATPFSAPETFLSSSSIERRTGPASQQKPPGSVHTRACVNRDRSNLARRAPTQTTGCKVTNKATTTILPDQVSLDEPPNSEFQRGITSKTNALGAATI